METFNLIDEPWIPVILTDGTPARVSLRGLFAPTVREVACPVPSQTMAVIRLATAIAQRALPSRGSTAADAAELRGMLAANGPDPRIGEYLDRWHDRFDLMDPVRPFMQSPGLPESATLVPLVSDIERNTALAARSADFTLSPADAALWLVRCQAFDGAANRATIPGDTRMKGGVCYTNGTGWAGSLGCLAVIGDTVWRTALLNRVPAPWDRSVDWSRDSAVWGRDIPTFGDPEFDGGKGKTNDPHGPAALLTWRSRSVRITWRGGRAVGAVVTAGDRINAQDASAYEPMSGWHESDAKKGTLVSTKLSKGATQLWRGLAGLLLASDKEGALRPMNVRWLERARLKPMPLRYLYTAIDWGPQSQNPAGETADMLTASLDLSGSRTAGRRYADRLALLDRGVWTLTALDSDLRAAEGRSAPPKPVPGKQTALESDLWTLLDRPTRAWLAGADPMGSLDRWADECLRSLDRRADLMGAAAPSRAWSGRMTADGKALGAAAAVARCHARIAKLRKGLAS